MSGLGRVLGVVPARAGSKRLPGKNTRLLGGKPLVGWIIDAVRQAGRIDRVVVSSDDAEVLAYARATDPSLPLSRPSELATDTSPAIDFVRHALEVVETEDTHFDTVVIAPPTSPFTLPEDIDRTLDLLENTRADSAVSVMRVDHAIHPVKLKIMKGDRLLPYLEQERGRMAAYQLPVVYVRNCSVYATRRRVIDAGEVIGRDCRGYEMPRERSLDINDPIDFEFAEFLLQRRTPHRRQEE